MLGILALVGTSIWLVFFSATLQVKKVEVVGNDLLSERRCAPSPTCRWASSWPWSTSTAPPRRVASLAEVKAVDVTRAWPDGVRIEVDRAHAPSPSSSWRGRLRGLDAEGVVFRDYKAVPKGMPPGPSHDRRPAPTRCARPRPWSPRCPDDLASRVDHVEVETIDQITLVLRDGREVLWGSAEESALKAQVLAGCSAEKGTVVRRQRAREPDHPTADATARAARRRPKPSRRVACRPSAAGRRLPMVFRNARLT